MIIDVTIISVHIIVNIIIYKFRKIKIFFTNIKGQIENIKTKSVKIDSWIAWKKKQWKIIIRL